MTNCFGSGRAQPHSPGVESVHQHRAVGKSLPVKVIGQHSVVRHLPAIPLVLRLLRREAFREQQRVEAGLQGLVSDPFVERRHDRDGVADNNREGHQAARRTVASHRSAVLCQASQCHADHQRDGQQVVPETSKVVAVTCPRPRRPGSDRSSERAPTRRTGGSTPNERLLPQRRSGDGCIPNRARLPITQPRCDPTRRGRPRAVVERLYHIATCCRCRIASDSVREQLLVHHPPAKRPHGSDDHDREQDDRPLSRGSGHRPLTRTQQSRRQRRTRRRRWLPGTTS